MNKYANVRICFHLFWLDLFSFLGIRIYMSWKNIQPFLFKYYLYLTFSQLLFWNTDEMLDLLILVSRSVIFHMSIFGPFHVKLESQKTQHKDDLELSLHSQTRTAGKVAKALTGSWQ